MAESFNIKLTDLKVVTSKSAKSRPLIRFTLVWEVQAGDARYGDSYAGCLAGLDDAGNTTWQPHRTRLGNLTTQYHVPSPDLIAFVRQLLDDNNIMQPLREAREEALGSVFAENALPDIEATL